MRSKPKTKLSYHDWFDGVWFVMKTKQDNDMIDCIGLVKVETKTKLLEFIWLGAICDEGQMDNDVTDHIVVVYVKNKT